MSAENDRLGRLIPTKKQIPDLLNFLEQEYQMINLESVKPLRIRKFLLTMQKKGKKPQDVNDLLKAFKCFSDIYMEKNTLLPYRQKK